MHILFHTWFALATTIPLSFCLDQATMQAHLGAASELLGPYVSTAANTSRWMSAYDDSTFIQNMNIPGTHDSLTWSVPTVVSPFIKTQDISLFEQLNRGVRFVDFRIGIVDNKLRMFHDTYQLSDDIELVSMFYGLYYWLDQNPTETILVSVKVDDGDTTPALQQQVYDLMNGPDVTDYWVKNITLPTLGEARHKLIPILRLGMNSNDIQGYQSFGINVFRWKDNNPSFSVDYVFDADRNPIQTVYVQDLYDPNADNEKAALQKKYQVMTSLLNRSMSTGFENTDKWFISFASGYNGVLTTPKQFALGSTIPVKTTGMNPRIRSFLADNRGSYFGVVMFDFIGSDQGLINATLGWETTSWGASTVGSARSALYAPFLVFLALMFTS